MRCNHCTAIFRNPETLVSSEQERARYLTHKNDVNNVGYQRFVQPIVTAVQQLHPTTAKGLDFGAGTGPVISKLLSEQGYTLALYDPFFHPDQSVLETNYDYIVCCEVIEHFHNPLLEFKRLKELLVSGGQLFCMTDLWDGTVAEFERWYYKNDKTHVIFYNKTCLEWMVSSLGFASITIEDRLITITKA
ncbi:MAG: class I SAM-dependent methyltransferase [Marinirhabdus sp.]|nr:class I SAM-dependent methyltransferase [Marinirhabdus sp.]